MNFISLWWESLTGAQQMFALMAIPATLILILQTLLLLVGLAGHGDSGGEHGHDDFGGGHDHDDFDTASHDIDGHDVGGDSHEIDVHGNDAAERDNYHETAHDGGLRIFTVRAFVAFFTIFGWMGIVLLESGLNVILSAIISLFAGFAAMFGMACFFKFALSLQSSGNVDIRNSLGKTGTVYIPIPPNRTGKGKITVLVQDRFTEVDAITDNDVSLKTGTEVVGVSMSNQNVICVTPVKR